MPVSKRWAAAVALAAAAPLLATAAFARTGPDAVPDSVLLPVPDSVLLQSADVNGARVSEGGPDATHTLPPKPCPGIPLATPLASRTVHATVAGGHVIYEYLARYASGGAAQAAEDLRAAVERCPAGPDGDRHKILATGTAGPHSMLLTRDGNDTGNLDAYLVGVAGDYLVVVADTGDGAIRPGDPTEASGTGSAAIRRAGGDPAPVPVPPAESSESSEPSEPSEPASPEPTASMPADHCDYAWIHDAVDDIPQHAYRSLQGCDGEWAVLDIDTTAADCGAGGRPGCHVDPRWQRHFMHFENGWVTVSGSMVAGCAGVHEVEPAFPEALCAGLPAL